MNEFLKVVSWVGMFAIGWWMANMARAALKALRSKSELMEAQRKKLEVEQ